MEANKSQKIMILDDSQMDRMLLHHSIKNSDYTGEVSCHDNPLEVLNLIQYSIVQRDCNNIPILIFLDLNMPQMNGFSFLDMFMNFPKEVINKCKIIILTASDDVSVIEKSAKYPNVIDFMVKPVEKINSMVKDKLSEIKPLN